MNISSYQKGTQNLLSSCRITMCFLMVLSFFSFSEAGSAAPVKDSGIRKSATPCCALPSEQSDNQGIILLAQSEGWGSLNAESPDGGETKFLTNQKANTSPKKGIDFFRLSEKQLKGFESCVCRCSLGFAPHVGAGLSLNPVRTYNPNASCAKLSNGPCIGGGYGCKRGFPKDSCIQKCMKEQGIDNYNAAKAHFDEWSRKVRPPVPDSNTIGKEKQDNTGRWGKDSGAGFSDISGRVMICSHKDIQEFGEDAWDTHARMANLKSRIHVYDHIKTWGNSEAVLGFADMSTFEMKPDTEIMISTPPEQPSKIWLVLGNIVVNVKKMLKDGSMDIEMNQAAASVKGTKFECIETGAFSAAQVYEGVVQLSCKGTKESVMLHPDQGGQCTKDGLAMYTLSGKQKSDSSQKVNNKGFAGIWTRTDNGRIVDVIIIDKTGSEYQASFQTSLNGPPYSIARGNVTDEAVSFGEPSEMRYTVNYDENIIHSPDADANNNSFIIDGNQSRGRVNLTFLGINEDLRQSTVILEVTVSNHKSAESKSGFKVLIGNRIVGAVGQVSRGQRVKIPLKDSGPIKQGKLTLTLVAAGNDGAYITSKASGRPAILTVKTKGGAKKVRKTLRLTSRNKQNKEIIIKATVDGDALHYNSYNEDGSLRFKGQYKRY
jgi:hypothetical protein